MTKKIFSTFANVNQNNTNTGMVELFCNESCKPIVRTCLDTVEGPTDFFYNVIFPLDVSLLILSALTSVFLQYVGDYSRMYQWTKSCGYPIVHLSVLHDFIETNYNFDHLDHEIMFFRNIINQKDQLYGETALHVAVRERFLVNELLKYFESFIDFSIEDNFGNSLVSVLADYNEEIQDEHIKKILYRFKERCAYPQNRDRRVWNEQLIFKAIIEKKLNMIYYFSLLELNWLSINLSGQSAVDLLLREMETQKDFLNEVTRVGILDKLSNYTVISKSCKNGYTECMKVFLEKRNRKDDVNVRNQYSGKTALHIAIQSNQLKCINVLLERGVNVNAKDIFENTPLILASRNGQIEVVKLLIEKGADVNAKYSDENALILALKNGHTEVGKLLIEKGVEVNEKMRDGNTTLFLALERGYIEVVKLLIDRGAEFKATERLLYNTLILVSANGHLEAVKFLIEMGAKVNTKDPYQNTPLKMASRNGHTEVAILLIEKDSEINAKDSKSNTPLILALENKHTEVAKLLIEKGAIVNGTEMNAKTPLNLALENGLISIAKLLIEKDANVHAKDWYGNTPANLALKNGHTEIAKLLIKKE